MRSQCTQKQLRECLPVAKRGIADAPHAELGRRDYYHILYSMLRLIKVSRPLRKTRYSIAWLSASRSNGCIGGRVVG